MGQGRVDSDPAFASSGQGSLDLSRPHPARIYDYLLGGKDNLAADRAVGEQLAEIAPWVLSGTRGNRAFLRRAVTYLARAGVRQYLDIGSGLPTAKNVHEIAQRSAPDCRVTYVDNDPVVLAYARALLGGDSRTVATAGDARDPDALFADPTVNAHLDFERPVAVLLVAVLHFLVGDDEVAGLIAAIRRRLVPGSHLVISHVADLPDAPGHPTRATATRSAAQLYDALAAPFTLRTREQVTALFQGFDLVPPGVVPAQLWWPARPRPGPAIPVLAGVGRLAGTHHDVGANHDGDGQV